ncbi:MAG: copper chaperone PCu(A)C [Sphingomonadaceae bacterium]
MIIARRAALPLFALAAVLSVAACKEAPDKPEAAASGAIEAKPGVKVTEARLVLPAVAGNPAAAYLTIDNQTKDTVSIAAIAIKGAGKAEMHTMEGNAMKPVDRVDVDAGTQIRFEPGKLHIMAFELGSDLAVGGDTEFTLTFTDGDKTSVPARIEAMGDAAMGGMKMGEETGH